MEDNGRRDELESTQIQVLEGAASLAAVPDNVPLSEAESGGAPVTICQLPERLRARETKRAEILVGILKRCTGKRFAEVRQVLEMLPKDILVEELRKVPARRRG